MLHEMSIRNFAIIDDLHLTFGQGLNILTGETGAGKSIIIDALGLLLGDRGTAEWVRAGSETAEIEATFRLESDTDIAHTVRQFLEEQGLDEPDAPEWVMLSREVRMNGRNVCRINGRAVNLQVLSEVTGHLIDVHGQGEHLTLLRPRTHIYLLDRYAGLLPKRRQISVLVSELHSVRTELQRLRQDARTIAQRVDLLSFQTEEIFSARLQAGEEEVLEGERRRLGNAETLLQLSQEAQALLSEGDSELPSVVDLVGEVVGRIERLGRIDPDMNRLAQDAQGLLEQLSDIGRDLQDYADQLEFNPDRLRDVEERIELIHNLKRKYGDSIPQILSFAEQAQAELERLENWEVRTTELEAREEDLLQHIGKLGAELSALRQAAGENLARQVEAELADLRMERARVGVAIDQAERADGAYLPDGRRVAFDSTGVDQIEFLISANPGEPLKPMAKVASGGETARLMLALKSVLAHADATPTLIFDEIDQGIGGRVGAVVGRKLWNLTGAHASAGTANSADSATPATVQHQVLCITHLPQLAAFGDRHFTVNKRIVAVDNEERTSTVVRILEGEERIEELAQMLGATTATARRSVEEMIDEVQRVKSSG